MLAVINLNYQFFKKPLFNNFSLNISAPKVCLTAPNGQGKTTLFSIIAGLIDINSGEIQFAGKTLKKPNHHVALASDKIVFPEFLTAKQVIELVCGCWQLPWPNELIEGFSFVIQLETKVSALSSGSLKKLQLITALVRDVPLLLLDEPSAALDHNSIEFLLSTLADRTQQIIITCHEPEPFIAQGFQLQALANV